MNFKAFAGLIGLLLLLGFLLPPVIKLKNIALGVVVLIGVGMAVYEFIETLRSPDD
ncbi:MAG: hypothetical protein KKF85_06580 [Gammaproteobacteria bacterium]|nr:hypothetical protein [Gammaproteobacteria bacterium]MBU3989224.1 hypothetical protein [Gammaproteobacteria bacterium]MBU4004325.1 hypothetical protein [Gammaproteobacteria bacterium]MBU4019734.1 hypothetical protein [Gammaproteobacteria bacterium]MBU4095133.1 hypothetical protein [Gammaproteobacteria bacterium]